MASVVTVPRYTNHDSTWTHNAQAVCFPLLRDLQTAHLKQEQVAIPLYFYANRTGQKV